MTERTVDPDELTDALERIRELEELICEAEPMSWTLDGYPVGTEDAQAWEKKAKALVARYPDAMKRTGMVRGPLPKKRHAHRFLTDEDGAVHPCKCGAPWPGLTQEKAARR